MIKTAVFWGVVFTLGSQTSRAISNLTFAEDFAEDYGLDPQIAIPVAALVAVKCAANAINLNIGDVDSTVRTLADNTFKLFAWLCCNRRAAQVEEVPEEALPAAQAAAEQEAAPADRGCFSRLLAWMRPSTADEVRVAAALETDGVLTDDADANEADQDEERSNPSSVHLKTPTSRV
jgi:hypothetical protein